uniref:Annexin n=1 Tax=Panagrolaimus davidi TaxID=227884 RepID=A0A914QQ80_9BILA
MKLKIARNVQLYFAEKLHEAIIGARCDPSTIIRILVSRSEIDLYDICEEYKRKYCRSIVTDLKETCSGDFYRLLKQLVDPQNIHLSFEDSNEI